MGTRFKLLGHKFGRWTVVEEAEKESDGSYIWLCICSCGQKRTISGASLVSGNSKSCGCLQRELAKKRMTTHGKSKTRTHYSWKHIIQRCLNPKSKGFERWGGRGIQVCERWLKFENFFADMGECPPGKSIERKNNDGNYEKNNCCWATSYEQSINKRNNIVLTFNGKTQVAMVWAIELGIKRQTILWRYHRGWPVEKILAK